MKILSYEPDRKVCDETDVDIAKLRLPPDRFDNATKDVAEKYSIVLKVGPLPPKEVAENRELQQA